MPGAPTERTPLALAAPLDLQVLERLLSPQGLKTGFLVCITITLSVGLINFNSYLMKDRFPFAVPLVLIQMAFCTTFASLLLHMRPSLFPSLTDPAQKVHIDLPFLVRGALPIGAVFATSLVLSNLAYAHLSVAFLQMMKEGNIVVVYGLSLVASLETFSWRHVQVIIFAIFAASLTVRGELAFSLVGFIIQLCSGISEAGRIVLQSLLLSGRKVDPLSYVLLISPICFTLLGLFMLLLLLLPAGIAGPGLAIPSAAAVWSWLPLLLANSMIAFALNVSIACVIKNTSPTSYIFVGVVKDIVAIVVSVFVLKELVSSLQVVSFTLQIGSVIVWSLLKMHPEKFEHGILPGLQQVFAGDAVSDMKGTKSTSLIALPKTTGRPFSEDAFEERRVAHSKV